MSDNKKIEKKTEKKPDKAAEKAPEASILVDAAKTIGKTVGKVAAIVGVTHHADSVQKPKVARPGKLPKKNKSKLPRRQKKAQMRATATRLN